MKANVGKLDRGVRLALAVLIAILLVTHVLQGLAAIIGAVAAFVLVATSLIGYCPAYALVGANTCNNR